MAALSTKDVLKCATMKHGEPFVMMDLTLMMQQFFVDKQGTLDLVSYSKFGQGLV